MIMMKKKQTNQMMIILKILYQNKITMKMKMKEYIIKEEKQVKEMMKKDQKEERVQMIKIVQFCKS